MSRILAQVTEGKKRRVLAIAALMNISIKDLINDLLDQWLIENEHFLNIKQVNQLAINSGNPEKQDG